MNIFSIKVHPFQDKKGAVPNQYEIICNNGDLIFFQSYDTVIACKDYSSGKVKICLDENWQNSMTTNKFRCIFLNENAKETEKKIKSGEYIIEDLNNKFREGVIG